MQLNVIYDQVSGSLPTGFVTAVNYVVNYFDNLFTNNVTINMSLGYGEVAGSQMPAGAVGASLPTAYLPISYNTAIATLQAEGAPGASLLPTTSPLSGTMYVPAAEAKAIGLTYNGAIDGYVGISSAYQYSYSSTAAPAAGQFDFIGVLEHEITELMGRTSFGNLAPNFYSEMDLFRYSAPGIRSTATGPTGSTSYFSVDNGTTNLGNMNNHYGNGDLADWYPNGPAPGGKDAFNDYTSSGVKNVMSSNDITLMQALGWTTGPQKSIVVAANVSEVVQGGSPVVLLKNGPTISDAAAATLASVTITIANGSGSAVAGDKLLVGGQQSGTVAAGLVSVSWNDSAKALTLSGNVSAATYQSLLSAITYQDTGTDSSIGSHPVRTVTWSVNDGTSIFNTTSQITVDRAPVVDANAASDLAGSAVSVPSVVGVLKNASDADGDALAVTGVSNAAHGTGTVGQALAGAYGQLTLNPNGSYSYTANNTAAIDSAPSASHLKDTFTYTVGDGFGGNANASLTITLDRAPVAANNMTSGVAGTTVVATVAQGVLSNASDADNDGIAVTGVSNAANIGGAIGQALSSAYGQLTLNGDGSYSYSANNIAAISGGPSGSHLQDTFKYTVSDGLGGSTAASLTVSIDRAPVVTALNVSLSSGRTSVAVASLVSATDADGDVVKGYQLSDATNDGGHFVVDGVVQSANQIYVTAAQLTNTTFVSGAVTNQLYVKAFDGSAWSPSQGFTVSPPTSVAPVVPDLTVSSLAGATIVAAAGGVLSNAVDANADTLVVTGVSDAEHGAGVVGQALAGVYGQFTLNSDGSYSYSANNAAAIGSADGGSHPEDIFKYTVSDGQGGTAAASVTMVLDRAPVLANGTVWDAAGAKATATAATGVLKAASDADGDALTVADVSNLSHGGGAVGHALTGAYGQLTLNADGSYSYDANNTAAINAAPSGGHVQDTFSYNVSDGHGGITASSVTFAIDRAPVAANSVASNIVGTTTAVTAADGVLKNPNDADGDLLSVTSLKNGALLAGTVGQALAGVYGQLTLNANGSYSYNASNTAAIASAPAGVHLQDTFSYTVDDGHGGSAVASLKVALDRIPVNAAADIWLDADQTSVSAASLFSVSDKDGDAIKAYQFYDGTIGGGHFVVNGVTQTFQQIYLSPAQLAQTFFEPGAVTDQLYVQTFDGTAWSSWRGFNVTPWAADAFLSAGAGASVAGALHQTTDANNGGFSVIELSDASHGAGVVGQSLAGAYGNVTINSDGSYNYTANNAATINAAPTGAHLQEIFSYTASDGHGSTGTATLTLTLNRAPVTTVGDVAAVPGPVAASSLFTAHDADGDAIRTYQLFDATPGSGHFLIDGVVQTSQNISVSAAQLTQTTFQSGPLTDSLYVSVFDGQSWSSWQGFKVNPVISHGDASVVTGQAVDGILDHSVVDSEDGPGFFSMINGSLVTGQEEHSFVGGYGLLTLNENGSYNYSADNLAAINSAPTGSHLQDTFTYATDDGQGGSTAASLTITLDRAPVTTSSDVTTVAGHSLAVSSLFTAADADGDTILAYQVSDTTVGCGHFIVDGVAQDAQQIYLTAAQMAQTTFQSASGTDQLYVSAFDGTAWSAWQGLEVTGVNTSPDGQTVLDAHQGNQTVTATSGPTTLMGGPNDVLNAGAGGDSFVFNSGFGANTINGFKAGSDVIEFDHSVFADANDVMSHLYQIGTNALIVVDDHNIVTLHDMQVASLHASDFHIV